MIIARVYIQIKHTTCGFKNSFFMSFEEIRKFLIYMQSNEDVKAKVLSSSTADDVALLAQNLGYKFSGDDLLRFNGQKVDKVTVRKINHPGEYH